MLGSTINDVVGQTIDQLREAFADQYFLPSSTTTGRPWLPSYALPTNWAGDLKGSQLKFSSANLNKTTSKTAHAYGVEAERQLWTVSCVRGGRRETRG